MISTTDRFLGSLLAGACGDALGAPFEFTSHIDMIVECGPGGVRDFWTDGGTPGAISDDTQLGLFTASALLARKSHLGLSEIEHLHFAYLGWLSTQGEHNKLVDSLPCLHTELIEQITNQGDRCPDFTTRSVLTGTKALGVFTTSRSKGCGAVARVAPIGLLYHRDPFQAFEVAAASARLTHGHPTGYLSAGAFAMMIGWVVQGRTLPEAVQDTMTYLRSEPGNQQVINAIIHAPSPTKDPDLRPNWMGFGWTAEEALAIAIGAVLTTHTLEDAVIAAANHDGNSSTTALMAGNLAGALYGVSAIPERWARTVEMRSTLLRVSGQLTALAP